MSQVSNPLEDMPPEQRSAIDSLLHLGEMSTDVEFCGFHFGLRTLRPDEEMYAARVVQPFRDTLREPHAWAAAQVGLALTHIDNDSDFCPPVGKDKEAFARQRFRYVTTEFFWPTIDFLHIEYSNLLSEQVKAIRSMQDLSQRSLRSFSPLADSLIEPGTFGDETTSEPLS
jgi:hypothetical protein